MPQRSAVNRRRFKRALSVAVAILGGVLLPLVWPGSAFAIDRPKWSPGPPWAPIAPHSGEMRTISDLFWVMLALSAIVFIIVTAFLITNIVRFSARPGGPTEGTQIFGNRRIEFAWTAVPFLVLILAFFFTVKGIHDINTPPKELGKPLDIVARGHQWWWEFYYPSLHVTTANEVHVPVNTSLHFHVESADVIHSFWVPQLQRQIDANPGQDNAVFVTMNRVGRYGGDCYEYCGESHAWMKFTMVVQPQAQFNDWARQEGGPAKPSTGLAALGKKVFLSNTCVNCHAINGTPAGGAVGPNLTHVGRRWALAAGAVPKTMKDTMAWIQDPSQYKPGVLMPGYPLLSKRDLRALATYLLSLK